MIETVLQAITTKLGDSVFVADDALKERLLAYATKKMNAALEDLRLSANG